MIRVAFGIICVGCIGAANAHHSFGYHFDPDKEVTIEGTVREFKFINPHARLLVDVAGEDGEIETWECEFRGSNGLARTGWTSDVFSPGEAVVVSGFGARRSETGCYFDSAILSDGTQINHTDPLGGDPLAEAAVSQDATPSGIPEFAGVWKRPGGPPAGRGPAPGMPNRFAGSLSEAGQRALEAYDPIVDDPSLQCKPVSLTRLWGTGNPTEIRQEEDLVTIHHEWMDVERKVYMDLSEHPEGVADRAMGHSIGWYEGDTLVIDTVAYEPSVLFQFPGLPHSNQLHTVERLTLDADGQHFDGTWTADDSEYFVEQISGTIRPVERTITVLQPYDCEPMVVVGNR